jgi:acetyl esterase/lipase
MLPACVESYLLMRQASGHALVIRDIEFARVDGNAGEQPTPLLLDLYLPKDAPAPVGSDGAHAAAAELTAPTPPRYPLVVWIHGGAWFVGSKESGGTWPRLTRHGYIVASINYRLSLRAPFPAPLRDCQTAIRYLRAHADQYHIDADHIGVWGASAGGHLAALLGTAQEEADRQPRAGQPPLVSARVQAVCDWFGPSDLWRLAAKDRQQYAILSLLLGGPVADNWDKAVAASPLAQVRKGDPPFLIMHGDRDSIVPLEQSTLLDAALRKAGAESTLVILHGADHFTQEFNTPEVLETVAGFFDAHLKPAAAAAVPAPGARW